MSHPGSPGDPGGDGAWAAYAEALGHLHRERDAAFEAHRSGQLADARRVAEVNELAARLTEQQGALVDLAARLRAPVDPATLTPSGVPPLDGDDAVADLHARVDGVDAAIAEARRVAVLPQLVPEWRGRFARAAVVYTAFAIPSMLLTVMMSLAGVGENRNVLLLFAVIWPAVTAVGGGAVVGEVARSRAGDDPSFEPERRAAGLAPGAGGAGSPGSGRRREPRYRWFGVILAWASWLVPGATLDWFASLWPG